LEAVQRRLGTNNPGKDLASVEHMTYEMEALLAKLQRVVDAMTASLGSVVGGAAPAPPPALAHTLQRHTEILHDYTQEFRKTRGSVSSIRDRAELLSGASASPLKSLAHGDSGASTELLYAERAALNGARVGADAAVQTGLNIKEDLERQRALFASMVERMETMSEGMPAVNRLIGQIRRKKKRDVFILAGVIGTLLFVTMTWRIR
jgi:golgi SNAP receptor complex member 1